MFSSPKHHAVHNRRGSPACTSCPLKVALHFALTRVCLARENTKRTIIDNIPCLGVSTHTPPPCTQKIGADNGKNSLINYYFTPSLTHPFNHTSSQDRSVPLRPAVEEADRSFFFLFTKNQNQVTWAWVRQSAGAFIRTERRSSGHHKLR